MSKWLWIGVLLAAIVFLYWQGFDLKIGAKSDPAFEFAFGRGY